MKANKKVTKRQLRKFLKTQGISYRYFKRVIRICNEDEKSTWQIGKQIVQHFLKEAPHSIFLYTFSWIESPEGYDYWDNIHKNWNTLFTTENGQEKN